jgi:hypothetical protein
MPAFSEPTYEVTSTPRDSQKADVLKSTLEVFLKSFNLGLQFELEEKGGLNWHSVTIVESATASRQAALSKIKMKIMQELRGEIFTFVADEQLPTSDVHSHLLKLVYHSNAVSGKVLQEV